MPELYILGGKFKTAPILRHGLLVISKKLQPKCYFRGSRCLVVWTGTFVPPRRKWCSKVFMSTRRPRKRTPSDSSRKRCSSPSSPRNEIRPPEPNTRCHGSPSTCFSTRATCREQRGYPAAFAIAPYVLTRPRGNCRMALLIAVTIGVPARVMRRFGAASKSFLFVITSGL